VEWALVMVGKIIPFFDDWSRQIDGYLCFNQKLIRLNWLMQIIKEAVNKGQMMLFVGVIYISDNSKHIQES